MAILLNQTLSGIIARLIVTNGHQYDMCYNEVGLDMLKMHRYYRFVVNTIEVACVVIWREEKLHFNLLLLLHCNPNFGIGNDKLRDFAIFNQMRHFHIQSNYQL